MSRTFVTGILLAAVVAVAMGGLGPSSVFNFTDVTPPEPNPTQPGEPPQPSCEPDINISVNKAQQDQNLTVYCAQSEPQPCTYDNANYAFNVSSVPNIFSDNNAVNGCLELLTLDFPEASYCVPGEALNGSIVYESFDVCITFNTAPQFGTELSPSFVHLNTAPDEVKLIIPITDEDGITSVTITDVSNTLMANDFSISSGNVPEVTYTRQSDFSSLVNVTSVDLSFQVTDAGRPALSTSGTFTLLLVNEDITCEDMPSIVYMNSEEPLHYTLNECTTISSNSLTYTATNTSEADLVVTILKPGRELDEDVTAIFWTFIYINLQNANNLNASYDAIVDITAGGVITISPLLTNSSVLDVDIIVVIATIFNIQKKYNLTLSIAPPPQCSFPTGIINVAQNDTIGTEYLQFACQNIGSSTEDMEYSIPDQTEDFFFSVNVDDQTSQAVIELKTAYNSSDFPSSVTVVIQNSYGNRSKTYTITTRNFPPQFVETVSEVPVEEDVSPSSVVYSFRAEDVESSVLYSVKGLSGDIPFEINADGSLVLEGTLNATETSLYPINITATDSEGASTSISVNVSVNDVNEVPQCAYNGSVTVNLEITEPVNSTVFVFQCFDSDLEENNKKLRYYMSGTSSEFQVSDYIEVVGTDIILKRDMSSLDTSVLPMISFTVDVADHGQPPLTTSTDVNLMLIDNRPACSNTDLQLTISERDTVGSCFPVTHTCVDGAQNDALLFSLVEAPAEQGFKSLTEFFTLQDGGSTQFSLCISTNITGNPGSYKSEMVVSNPQGYNISTTVTVQVREENDPPTITNLPQDNIYNVLETVKENHPVAVLQVEDPDVGHFGILSFTFSATDPEMTNSGDFNFSSSAKTIYVAQPLNATSQYEYFYTLTVTDGGGLSISVNLTIRVEDVNMAPDCKVAEVFTINATTPVNYEIGTLTCWDTDVKQEYTQIIYELQPPEHDVIEVTSSGSVVLKADVPYTQSQLVYTVTVGNGLTEITGPSVNVTVTVLINNDFPPTCNASKMSISFKDTDSIGCAVAKVTCTNPLEEALNVSSVESNLTQNFVVEEESSFNSVSFRMCAVSSFKYDIGQFTVTTLVTNVLGSTQIVWTLTVTDVNEPPVFQESEYTREVKETVPVGTTLAEMQMGDGPFTETFLMNEFGEDIIRVTDPDNVTTRYQIASYDVTESVFIYKANGTSVPSKNLPISFKNLVFTVMDPLDEALNYKFVIQVLDQQNETSSAVYTITVIDVNEAPTCTTSSITFALPLITDINTEMQEGLVCSDPDYEVDKTQTVYSLQGPNSDVFSISESGVLKTVAKLPRDKDDLQFEALASDQANSSLSFTVTISVTVDRNVAATCSPVMEPPAVWVINSCIQVNLTCVDPAADATSTIAYSPRGNYTKGFVLSGSDGNFNLCYTLTTSGTFIFEVEADNGLQSTTVTEVIQVGYLQSTPNFDQGSYEADVQETISVGDTVVETTAVTEGNFSGNIIYAIISVSPQVATDVFTIEKETGKLVLSQSVTKLIQNQTFTVDVVVQATDDLSTLQSSVNVKLHIKETNVAPTCESIAKEMLDINSPVSTEVTSLVCTDTNFNPELNKITYSLTDQYFTVDDEGKISLKTTLPLTKVTHALSVRVSDGDLVTTITVVVDAEVNFKPEVVLVNITTTTAYIRWSFEREDFVTTVRRFSVRFQFDLEDSRTVYVTDKREYEMKNLQPDTLYLVRVIAETFSFGNLESDIITAKTHVVPVYTRMSVRYKDVDTQWTNDLADKTSAGFKNLASTTQANLLEGLKDVQGLANTKVIGFSPGSVNVDGIVTVNQTGDISVAADDFQSLIYSGQLGTLTVDSGSAEVYFGDKYINIYTIDRVPSTTFINEGENLSVKCYFRLVGEDLSPKVTWTLNGFEIMPTSTLKYTEAVTRRELDGFGYEAELSVSKFGKQDEGTYKCQIQATTHLALMKSKEVTLQVLLKPVVVLDPVTIHVEAGTNIELNCSVLAGTEDVLVFRWYRDRSLLTNPPVLSNSMSEVLTISNVQDNSEYFCRVVNLAGETDSITATISILSKDAVVCENSTDAQDTLWEAAPVGRTSTKNCPKGYTGMMERECDEDGEWQRADYTKCILEELVQLQTQVKTVEDGVNVLTLEEIAEMAENVTKTADLVAGDMDAVINILDQVINVGQTRPTVKQNMIESIVKAGDNMLKKDEENWKDLFKEGKSGPTSLMKTIEEAGQVASDKATSDLSPGEVTVISTDKIVLEYAKTSVKDIVFPDPAKNKYPDWVKSLRSTITLKNTSFSKVVQDGDGKYSGVVYQSIQEVLEDLYGTSEKSQSSAFGDDLKGKELNSRILSLTFTPELNKLEPRARAVFEHAETNFSAPRCGFLDFSPPHSKYGKWSTEGCEIIESESGENHTVCVCNHLTNFAILMSPGSVSEEHTRILSIISAVGCGISMFFLVLTICIYIFLWRYVKSDRAIILLNLCVALIVAYAIFLGGVNQTDNTDVCTAIAALLHFFFLVVFFLMLAEGIEVLVSVVYVFNTKSRLRWLLLFSWGVPVIIVGISLGITKLEGYGTDFSCWLSLESGLLWAFVGPALAVILANFIIVFIVLKTMFSTTSMMTKSAMEKGRAGLKALCVLLPLMGVTWVFGVFSVNESLVVFQYLFAVFNTLQGFFIFIFHCIMSRKVQDGMKNRRRRYLAKSIRTLGTDTLSQVPPSKLVTNSSISEDKTNDLDRKVQSPFREADREVQEMANKLYPHKANLLKTSENSKSNVPVDLEDVKLMNSSKSPTSPGKFIFQENAGWMKEGHVYWSAENASIEENDAMIGTPPTKSYAPAPPSPKKTAWGEADQSAPIHFNNYRIEEKSPLKKAGQLPPLKAKPKISLVDHYDPPPPHILANPRIQNYDPDLEMRLQDRRTKLEQVYPDSGWAAYPNKGKKDGVSKRVSGQSQKSKTSSHSSKSNSRKDHHEDLETIHLHEGRSIDMPLYRGRADDNYIKIKAPVDRYKRQQKHYFDPPGGRPIVQSEEDLSRYGRHQPFGGIRPSDAGLPVMSRPRREYDPRRDYW